MQQPSRKRVTLTEPLVVDGTVDGLNSELEDLASTVAEVDPSAQTFEEKEEEKKKRLQQQEADRAKGVATPVEAARAIGGLVGDAVVKPVMRTGQFAVGAALGTQSIFDHIATSLAANEAMNGLLERLENQSLTAPQRRAIEDQMEDIEKTYTEMNPAMQVYKQVDQELEDRFQNDSSYNNAISDFGEVVTSFPTMVRAFLEAAYDEDPETMKKLGFLMSGGGIVSTMAMLNPDKIGRNFDARPASVILGVSPAFGIVARAPRAMQALRGKFGKQTDVLLRAVETVDNTARSGMAKVAQSEIPGRVMTEAVRPFANVIERIPGEATSSMAAGLRGLGKVGEDVVRVGEARTTQQTKGFRGEKQRITELVPGVRFMTAGDLANSFVSGAKKGFLAGVPVETGAVLAVARLLYPRTRMTRNMARSVGQFLRHTSAQGGASPELAVRGIMMASAEQRNRIRSIADRIDKAFREEDALARRDGDTRMDVFFEGEPFQPGQKRQIDYEFTESGQEFLPVSRADILDTLGKLEKQRDRLLDDQRKPGAKKYTNQQIRQLNAEIKSLRQAVESDAPDVFPNQTLREAIDDLDEVLREAGVDSGIELVKSRLANVADRNAILLQSGDVAELVIRAIKRKYGNRLSRAGVTDAKLRKLILDHAEEPYFGSTRLAATVDIENVGRLDLDSLTRRAFESLRPEKQKEVMGQVASNAALRYSQLVTEAAKGAALKRESAKLGMAQSLEGVSLTNVQPQVYAMALARMLAGKDLTRGGVSLPQVIPKSASGPALPAALRDLATDRRKARKILEDVLGDEPSAREEMAFERVLRQTADEVGDYTAGDGYAQSFTNDLKVKIADNPDLPADVRKLAQQVETGEYAYSPGFAGTLNWMAKYQGKQGFWRDIIQLFKGNQTVRNIMPHINNSVGNVSNSMLSSGEGPVQFIVNSYRDGLVYLDHKAGKLGDYRKNTTPGSEEYFTNRAAVAVDQSGVGNTDFVAGELLRSSRKNLTGDDLSGPVVGALRRLGETKLGYVPRKLNELASKAYAKEDNLPKVHIGMDRGRQTFRDIFDLRPNEQMTIRTSPVSTRTIFKDKSGQIREGTPSNPGRVLTDRDINKIVAADVRQHVQKFVVSYDERSGLNRFVTNNPVLAPFNPFFTFTDKAAGLGGRKGFVEHLLFPADGVVSTSPKVALRQIKSQAALAARRAVLVNSFQALASNQENLLAQALAFDPAVPNQVIFEMLTDPSAIQYRDISGMSVFGPGEVKYRAFAYAIGKMLQSVGYDKNPKLSKKQRQFFTELNNGEVAHIGTIGSLFGVDRGPGLSLFELVINRGDDRHGQPVNLTDELLKRIAPFAVPAPIAVAMRELAASMSEDLSTFSGRQFDRNDVQLNEKRTDFFLRRFLLQGGRKVRLSGSTKSILDRKIERIKDHERELRKRLLNQMILLKNEKKELERQKKKIEDGQGSVGAEMFMNTPGDMTSLTDQIQEKADGLERTTQKFKEAHTRLAPVMKEEIQRLVDAYKTVERIGSLRKRLKQRIPTDKVPSLKERRRIMKEAR